MPRIQFSKWDPSGNTTLFFPSGTQGNHAVLAHEALLAQKLGGEQAGFVDTDAQSLVMAGGEFCVNATRCLGALLDLTAQRSGADAAANSPRTYTVRVSGWPDSIPLRVTGRLPEWQVEASLSLSALLIRPQEDGSVLVDFPGISHLLISAAGHPEPEPSTEAALEILRRTGLVRREAAGVVWWRQQDGEISIQPVVYVRDADTLYAEQACGSASISLALLLFRQTGLAGMKIRQPSGDVLDVNMKKEPGGRYGISISGSVRLSAEGFYYTEG